MDQESVVAPEVKATFVQQAEDDLECVKLVFGWFAPLFETISDSRTSAGMVSRKMTVFKALGFRFQGFV